MRQSRFTDGQMVAILREADRDPVAVVRTVRRCSMDTVGMVATDGKRVGQQRGFLDRLRGHFLRRLGAAGWARSRRLHPKQFTLLVRGSLFQQTLARITLPKTSIPLDAVHRIENPDKVPVRRSGAFRSLPRRGRRYEDVYTHN